MYFRGQRVRSTRRFLVETSVLGLFLACLFPIFDAWMNRKQGASYLAFGGADLLAPVLGSLCALTCGAVFRRQFLTHNVTGAS